MTTHDQTPATHTAAQVRHCHVTPTHRRLARGLWVLALLATSVGCDQTETSRGASEGSSDCATAVQKIESCYGAETAQMFAPSCDDASAAEVLASPCGGSGKSDETEDLACKLGLRDCAVECGVQVGQLTCDPHEEFYDRCDRITDEERDELNLYADLSADDAQFCSKVEDKREQIGIDHLCVDCRGTGARCMFNVECLDDLVCRPEVHETRVQVHDNDVRFDATTILRDRVTNRCLPLGGIPDDPGPIQTGDYCDSPYDCQAGLECRRGQYGVLECVESEDLDRCRWSYDLNGCFDDTGFRVPQTCCGR